MTNVLLRLAFHIHLYFFFLIITTLLFQRPLQNAENKLTGLSLQLIFPMAKKKSTYGGKFFHYRYE